MEEELIDICEGLGRRESDEESGETTYIPSEDCLECLVDLERALHRDNPKTKAALLLLGKWKIVHSDIVPIMLSSRTDHELLFQCIRVLALMTMPVSMEVENRDTVVLGQEHMKEAMIGDVLGIINAQLIRPIESLADPSTSGDDRDNNNAIIELVLVLYRNLLSIRALHFGRQIHGTPDEYRLRLQGELVECFHRENVFNFILAVCGFIESIEQDGWYWTILETLDALLVDIDVESLIHAMSRSSMEQKKTQVQTLTHTISVEKSRKPPQTTTRHTHFGGTFVRKFSGAPVAAHATVTSTPTRSQKRKPKGPVFRRTSIQKAPKTPSHILSTPQLSIVGEFMIQMIESGCFGLLMKHIDKMLEARRRSLLENREEMLIISTISFFSEFFQSWDKVRTKKGETPWDIAHLGSCISSNVVAYLLDRIDFFYMEKMHAQVETTTKCLSHVLSQHERMAKSDHRDEVLASEGLQSWFIYEKSHTDVIFRLLACFRKHLYSYAHLSRLIHIAHLVVAMLERNKSTSGKIRVQTLRKRRVSRRSMVEFDAHYNMQEGEEIQRMKKDDAKKKDQEEGHREDGDQEEEDQEEEDGVGIATEGEEENGGEEEQVNGQVEGEIDDAKKIDADEEVDESSLSLGQHVDESVNGDDDVSEKGDPGRRESQRFMSEKDEGKFELEEKELTLSFESFVMRFSHWTILDQYVYVLEHYITNPVRLNYEAVRMLHRLVYEVNMRSSLYQLRFLNCATKIINDPTVKHNPSFRDMYSLCSHVCRHFICDVKKRSLLFVECLFHRGRSSQAKDRDAVAAQTPSSSRKRRSKALDGFKVPHQNPSGEGDGNGNGNGNGNGEGDDEGVESLANPMDDENRHDSSRWSDDDSSDDDSSDDDDLLETLRHRRMAEKKEQERVFSEAEKDFLRAAVIGEKEGDGNDDDDDNPFDDIRKENVEENGAGDDGNDSGDRNRDSEEEKDDEDDIFRHIKRPKTID
eukprot:TRINITY_DN691_c0_g7_i1.p1 TRINITY_DN691_c0_g7~~TRINITY_DN691_c0_g7_i1.p1  ORF type:complete len:979 (+),score=316.24 TRINITY_DN691_c0_g7_i1:237-3173(+)